MVPFSSAIVNSARSSHAIPFILLLQIPAWSSVYLCLMKRENFSVTTLENSTGLTSQRYKIPKLSLEQGRLLDRMNGGFGPLPFPTRFHIWKKGTTMPSTTCDKEAAIPQVQMHRPMKDCFGQISSPSLTR